MSTINKKPFIKSLIEDLKENEGYLEALQLLIDGSGNQIPLLRTLSIKPSGNRTNITAADAGVHLCNLEANYSLYNGYLCFTDNYCVLISFTDSQKLTMFMITDGGHNFETIDEELSVLELRSELMDISGGGSSGSGSGLPDTTPTITLTSETITLAFNEGVLPTHIKLSNGIIVDLQGNEYCAEGDETVAQSINSGRVVIVISGDFTSLPSVNMTNLIWTLIDNPSNFSFDDLPRFSDNSDVDDFPGGEGSGGGSGSSTKSARVSASDVSFTVINQNSNPTNIDISVNSAQFANILDEDFFKIRFAVNSSAMGEGNEWQYVDFYLTEKDFGSAILGAGNIDFLIGDDSSDSTGANLIVNKQTGGCNIKITESIFVGIFSQLSQLIDDTNFYIEISTIGSSSGGSGSNVTESSYTFAKGTLMITSESFSEDPYIYLGFSLTNEQKTALVDSKSLKLKLDFDTDSQMLAYRTLIFNVISSIKDADGDYVGQTSVGMTGVEPFAYIRINNNNNSFVLEVHTENQQVHDQLVQGFTAFLSTLSAAIYYN